MSIDSATGEKSELPPGALMLGIGLSLAVLVALQALPADWRGSLQYQREAVAAGQWWRLLTANLVHLGWRHLLLNAVGLALILWLFGPDRGPIRWLLALLLSGLASSLGVHFWAPEVHWMVGLSGALHGLFLVGACGWLRSGDRLAWLLIAGLLLKLAWEHFAGAVPLSAEVVGGAVITDAHLWGSAGGMLAAGLETLARSRSARRPL